MLSRGSLQPEDDLQPTHIRRRLIGADNGVPLYEIDLGGEVFEAFHDASSGVYYIPENDGYWLLDKQTSSWTFESWPKEEAPVNKSRATSTKAVLLTLAGLIAIGMFAYSTVHPIAGTNSPVQARQIEVATATVKAETPHNSSAVAPLSQLAEPWGNQLLGLNTTADGTIGNYGCNAAAFAMVMQAFGSQDNPLDVNNIWLAQGAFSHEGFIDMKKAAASLGLSPIYFGAGATGHDTKLQGLLEQGYPGVAYSQNYPGLNYSHYVFLKGFDQQNQEFIYNNPWSGLEETRSTDSFDNVFQDVWVYDLQP
jgi:hypothetical protein